MTDKFISVEGGEGAGKSTLIRFLRKQLEDRGFEVVTTREPGGSFLGEEIRELLLHVRRDEPVDPKAELLLFLASRAQHVETLIRPSLESGKVVITDRFSDSTLAYQSAARGLSLTEVRKLCELVEGGVTPSLTFFLDVDPKIGVQRAKKRSVKAEIGYDRLEEEELSFHVRVREGFLAILEGDPKRVFRIDTAKPIPEVQKKALEILEGWLTRNGCQNSRA